MSKSSNPYKVQPEKSKAPVVIFIVLILIIAGAFGYAMFHFKESPGQVVQRVVDFFDSSEPAPITIGKSAPVPTLVPEPEQEPEMVAIPEPSKESTLPEPEPLPMSEPESEPALEVGPLTWLMDHKESWPEQVTLKEPYTFDIILDGEIAGSADVPAGTQVHLLDIESDTISVAFRGGEKRVSLSDTDILALAVEAQTQAEAAALAPKVMAPPVDIAKTQEVSPPQPVRSIFSDTNSFVTELMDEVIFGDEESEAAHRFHSTGSEVIKGGMGQSARIILPRDGDDEAPWLGNELHFTVKLDRNKQHYVTVKFWGSEYSTNAVRLQLFIEGKQIGQRHLGEVDPLDIIQSKPRYLDRFFYKTQPLPDNITSGKNEVELSIQVQGNVWAYGKTIETFQHNLNQPSRGIYRVYVHTDPCFIPAEGDVQGKGAPKLKKRPFPGDEVISNIKVRLNKDITKLMNSEDPIFTSVEKAIENQENLLFLSGAYHLDWTDAYQNEKAVKKAVEGLDQLYQFFVEDPEIVSKEWHSIGEAGGAVSEFADALEPYLDESVPGMTRKRREAWEEMFETARNAWVGKRRNFTNQSIIVDLAIYRSNRAMRVLGAAATWKEEDAIRLFHESTGLEPWSGSWTPKCKPDWSKGDGLYIVSGSGLTKESGFVGDYGEIVQEYVLLMYEASRPAPDVAGDPRVREQLVRMTKVRAPFRYPLYDKEGYRAMCVEGVIGWRDWKFPGSVMYDQLPGGQAGPGEIATSTLDPDLIGYAQQMLKDDNQYFNSVVRRQKAYKAWGRRILFLPSSYEILKEQPDNGIRLPMTPGQPDFVFADPEIAVLALKNGDDILYASLFWRARYAINNLARIHYMTPEREVDATIYQDTKFRRGGGEYVMPDYVNAPWSAKYEALYKSQGQHLARAGIVQPVAKPPSWANEDSRGENTYSGMGQFYLTQYGPYFIAMNCTKKQSFGFNVPDEFIGAKDLVTGEIANSRRMTAEAWQTIVLYRE